MILKVFNSLGCFIGVHIVKNIFSSAAGFYVLIVELYIIKGEDVLHFDTRYLIHFYLKLDI